jgi:hypothetical protein
MTQIALLKPLLNKLSKQKLRLTEKSIITVLRLGKENKNRLMLEIKGGFLRAIEGDNR